MENNLCKRMIVILVLLVVLGGCDITTPTQVDDGWNLVTHEAFNFSIEYPNNLFMKLGNEFGYRGMDYVRFIVGTTGAQIPSNLIITVETRANENPSLNDVIDWGNENLDEIQSDPVIVTNLGFEEIFLVEEQINNVFVYRRRYAYRQSGLLFEEVYLARENDMVILTIRVDDEYFDESLVIFNQMVESFEPKNR